MPDNKQELAALTPILRELGCALDERQPHIAGERLLTGPLDGGHKLLLLGSLGGTRAVIKASRDPRAMAEIANERACRDFLERIAFATEVFHSPKELLYEKRGGYAVLVTEFIEQEKTFLERPIEEQFGIALRSFKAQESAHAATYEHARAIVHTFGEMRSGNYVERLAAYAHEAGGLARALEHVVQGTETLEQYCGFLTHWDFMPQNIRVRDGKVYLLDHSSLRFGNKYEGWARFINFMELYNPPLARALVQYVRDNRTPEESVSQRLMRVYRLGELIRYYHGWLPRTQDNLRELAQARIAFWHQVLDAVLSDREVPAEIVESYKKTRDSLRSDEEKERQIGLH